MSKQLMYCIRCETAEMVYLPSPSCDYPPYHLISVPGHPDVPPDIDECEGPFAACPPPEFTEEVWENILSQDAPPEEVEYA